MNPFLLIALWLSVSCPSHASVMTAVSSVSTWSSGITALEQTPVALTAYAPQGIQTIGRGRGLVKVGTGRGLESVGRGRGLMKVGTGRGLMKVGTGRGLAKVGTGRGSANVVPQINPTVKGQGSGGGDPDPDPDPDPPPPPDTGGKGPSGGGDDSGGGGAAAGSGSDGDPADQKIDADQPVVPFFIVQAQEFVDRGDQWMEKGKYAVAQQQYSVAQQVEGLGGSSNLRLAGSLIALGRYNQGMYCMKFFLDSGGRISEKAFCMPEDEALEKRLDGRIEKAPWDSDLRLGAAVYHYSRGNLEAASVHLAGLREVNPTHPCLNAFEEAIQAARIDREAAGADPGADPDKAD